MICLHFAEDTQKKRCVDESVTYDISSCQARVESFGKTFVVGEHGFCKSQIQSLNELFKKHWTINHETVFEMVDSNVSSWKRFYDTFKGAGALIWSLREHSEVSGFKTHAEGNNIFRWVLTWSLIDDLLDQVVNYFFESYTACTFPDSKIKPRNYLINRSMRS